MTRSAPRLALVLSLALTSACAGSINGTIDGEGGPSFSEAFFAFLPLGTSGFDRMQVRAVTFGGACATLTEVADRTERATDDWFDDVAEISSRTAGTADDRAAAVEQRTGQWHDELDAIHQEHLPEVYWEAQLLILAEDRRDLDGERFDIRDAATLQVCRHEAWPDHGAAFEAEDNADRQEALGVECFTAEDGDVTVDSFEDEETAELSGDAELVDVDEDDAGDVEFKLSAVWCAEYEEELD